MSLPLREVDLLVVGAGFAGMIAAIAARQAGLEVLLAERSEFVGGTTAASAGTLWIPGTRLAREAGFAEPPDAAAAYLDACIGPEDPHGRRAAFLADGPAAVDWLIAATDVALSVPAVHPDYGVNLPGAVEGGRALATLPFDGRRLGADFARLRPPRRELTALGGMMVGKDDVAPLLAPLASWRHARHVSRILGRHFLDRLRHPRGTRLLMGNALAARLLTTLRRARVPVVFGAPLLSLTLSGPRVVGAALGGATPARIATRRGVLLAGGGFSGDTALRVRVGLDRLAAVTTSLQDAGESAVGVALRDARAALDGEGEPAFWFPVSRLQHRDGTEAVFPHILLDRAKPGVIAVGQDGRRFVDESLSYHDFCEALLRRHGAGASAWLLADARAMRRYGLGMALPGRRPAARLLRAGYLRRAVNTVALAREIGVPPQALAETLRRYNAAAALGEDPEYGRGTAAVGRANGDPAHRPNPCVAPLEAAPLYAVRVEVADLGTSAGLAVDAEARVLDRDGRPVPGLWAAGNDAASIMRGHYPGPGITLGPALVFARRAALDAARQEG